MDAIWIAKLVWLLAAYLLGLVGGVFVHELGHAVAALLGTRQSVELQIGRDEEVEPIVWGRLSMRCSWRGLRYGFTRYDRGRESRLTQTFVAAAGPLTSLCICLIFFLSLTVVEAASFAWVLFLGLFVANLRILVTALWPRPYQPDGLQGETWLSDGLDIWRMWRR